MAKKKDDKKPKITFEDIDALLDPEIAEWEKEISDIEELYVELKKSWDNVKKKASGGNASSGSYNFMITQTENLIKIKEAKIKMKKEKFTVKKSKMDLKFAALRVRDDSSDNDNFKELAKEMYNEFFNHKDTKTEKEIVTQFSPDEVKIDETDDKILEERMAKIEAAKKAKMEEEEKKEANKNKELDESSVTHVVEVKEEASEDEIMEEPQEEEVFIGEPIEKKDPMEETIKEIEENKNELQDEIKYVTNMDGVVIAVDEDYNEILGVEIPEQYKKIKFSIDENDNIYAFTEDDGEVIEIVEF